MCLERESHGCCSGSHPGTGEGCAEWEEGSQGPFFWTDLHLLNSWFKKEQLIHGRLRHSQAPGTLPGGELSAPAFAAGPPPGLGTGSRGSSESAGEEAALKSPGSSSQVSNGKTEQAPRKLSLSSMWPRGGREGSCVQGHSLTRGGAGRPLARPSPALSPERGVLRTSGVSLPV